MNLGQRVRPEDYHKLPIIGERTGCFALTLCRCGGKYTSYHFHWCGGHVLKGSDACYWHQTTSITES